MYCFVAVVIMHTLHPGAKHLQLPFYNTLEDHYNVISQYYQLPSLSLRGAIWQGLVNNWEGYTAKDIFIGMETVSQRHLNELGHKYLTDLAVGLVQQTYQEVLLQPYTLAGRYGTASGVLAVTQQLCGTARQVALCVRMPAAFTSMSPAVTIVHNTCRCLQKYLESKPTHH